MIISINWERVNMNKWSYFGMVHTTCSIDWLIYGIVNLLDDWSMFEWFTKCSIDWLIYGIVNLLDDRSIGIIVYWLFYWLIGGNVHWMTDL